MTQETGVEKEMTTSAIDGPHSSQRDHKQALRMGLGTRQSQPTSHVMIDESSLVLSSDGMRWCVEAAFRYRLGSITSFHPNSEILSHIDPLDASSSYTSLLR
mmetsp:Transcript_12496/g.25426  ORF Transcript_12496/g.25426 Transcript_12496/m.25426 type:complete len:102 (-) Transcript_12496:106-411(-)